MDRQFYDEIRKLNVIMYDAFDLSIGCKKHLLVCKEAIKSSIATIDKLLLMSQKELDETIDDFQRIYFKDERCDDLFPELYRNIEEENINK